MAPTAHDLKRDRYREWLTAQRLLFGFETEIASRADAVTNGVTNDAPPVQMWHRILPTVHLVEKLRERFGATTINSAYRSPAYNAAVGGKVASRHMSNDALDVRCATGTPEQWAEFLRGVRRGGVFAGGIGTYPTFVHVDTRGTNTDWTG